MKTLAPATCNPALHSRDGRAAKYITLIRNAKPASGKTKNLAETRQKKEKRRMNSRDVYRHMRRIRSILYWVFAVRARRL
ncbi:hypothetical protein HNQ95_006702 [Aminobacter ciceronei]|jgi:hypothetical protein|uniref:Transposase n=1 Tax=Aminobacter ciceronei TaxID=150723 RepID=A0ABR6CI22_9HYPH|nr:hypothetical protein [Aminobacter ciceronei]MBA9024663.1 hypothetical protein [Aminobacter ciceronei]